MSTLKSCVSCHKIFQINFGEEWKTYCLPCYLKNKQQPKHKPVYANPFSMDVPDEMLKRLIILCHPDKHSNSELSNNVTAWLLGQKQRREKKK